MEVAATAQKPLAGKTCTQISLLAPECFTQRLFSTEVWLYLFQSVVLSSQLTMEVSSTDDPGAWGASISEANDPTRSGAGMLRHAAALSPVAALMVLLLWLCSFLKSTLFSKYRLLSQNVIFFTLTLVSKFRLYSPNFVFFTKCRR